MGSDIFYGADCAVNIKLVIVKEYMGHNTTDKAESLKSSRSSQHFCMKVLFGLRTTKRINSYSMLGVLPQHYSTCQQ
jgi:hypothetical protein